MCPKVFGFPSDFSASTGAAATAPSGITATSATSAQVIFRNIAGLSRISAASERKYWKYLDGPRSPLARNRPQLDQQLIRRFPRPWFFRHEQRYRAGIRGVRVLLASEGDQHVTRHVKAENLVGVRGGALLGAAKGCLRLPL